MTHQAPATGWRKSTHSTDTGGACVEVAPVLLRWRKSSHSDNTGGQCVEVASMVPVSEAEWRKSSRSTNTGGQCVEVADLASAVAVRDSKDPDGPMLVFGASAWSAFAARAKGGHLDLT
ncbi:DUF397 domain-containing protein [Actinomadura sp. LD22]|uniref:DUF397 domain-containing protein n=1 Tax=Actinomadura physcomitrii TaxID=2650748 RepID=A0A6I4MHM1_9ACTN|nr:DUF397 domain-containing protein [Actinomadura physcomitrii]MWA04085.1 DUF397 domain-containing protein [Actinomadura physcomitrii]